MTLSTIVAGIPKGTPAAGTARVAAAPAPHLDAPRFRAAAAVIPIGGDVITVGYVLIPNPLTEHLAPVVLPVAAVREGARGTARLPTA